MDGRSGRNGWKMKLAAIPLAGALLLAGCAATVGYVGNDYSWGSKGEMSGRYKTFNGTKERKIKTDPGDTIVMDYDSSVKKGSLSLRLEGPDGSTMKDFPVGEKSTIEVKSAYGGDYRVVVNGKNTGGSFSVSWKVKE